MKEYIAYFLFFMLILISCTRKSDETCTDSHENTSPRLLAYFKPEGTTIKYKSTKGDTATLTFGSILAKETYREEKKPCKHIYYTKYSQELSMIGTLGGIFPYKQEMGNNYTSDFLFSTPNTGLICDFNDKPPYPVDDFSIDGKEYRNLLIWTNKRATYNILSHDSILYNSTYFIVKLKQADNTVWTILN